MDIPLLPGRLDPRGVYELLYVATFALHQAFVHYVLAGSLYSAWAMIFPGRGAAPRARQPLAALLHDWMPFVLSAAITAGVAPLLFVQILYPESFYTANVLLSWRFAALLPALVAAFYLLYVVKSGLVWNWPPWLQAAVAVAIAACFVYVGLCWTANHLVGLATENWPAIYESGALGLRAGEVFGRAMIWIGGSFATWAVIAGLQLARRPEAATSAGAIEARRLALLALSGMLVALGGGAAYAYSSPPVGRLLQSPAALQLMVIVGVGWLLQAGVWSWQFQMAALRAPLLGIAAVGCLLAVVSISQLREMIRLDSLPVKKLIPGYAQAAEVGGFQLFVVVALVNLGLIAGCIWLVRRNISRAK